MGAYLNDFKLHKAIIHGIWIVMILANDNEFMSDDDEYDVNLNTWQCFSCFYCKLMILLIKCDFS